MHPLQREEKQNPENGSREWYLRGGRGETPPVPPRQRETDPENPETQ